jgi:hypothetical protein
MKRAERPSLARERGVWAARVLATLPYVTLLGFGGLVVNVILSFEEPHGPMLLASGLLLFAAPVGVFLHLATTPELTPQERRLWLAGLMGGSAALFAAYFNRTERRTATRRLVEAAARRAG